MPRTFRTFMNRVTALPQDPTARVIINGLGLLCFSRKYNRAEVGFLETESRHPLLLTIYDRLCNVVPPILPELQSGAEITINSNNPGLGQLYTPDMGARPDNSDEHDFRHLLNLDEMHLEVFDYENVQIKADVNYLAKLFLSNGVFFNAKRSTHPAKIRHRPKSPGGNNVTVFPRIGKVIGANIGGDQVLVTVNGQPIPLARDANSPYTIVIRYKCEREEGNAETDFERFHNALNLPKVDALDVFYNDIEPPDRIDCEKHLERAFNEKTLSEEFCKNENLIQLIKSFGRSEEACQASTKPQCPGNLLGQPEPCT